MKKKKKRTNFFLKLWDEEKKTILVLKNSNISFFDQKRFLPKVNFFIEEILSLESHDRVENFLLISNKNYFLKWMKYFHESNFSWFYFIIFSYITKNGFFAQRFRLFDTNITSPDFFCSQKKKITETVFSILFLKKGFSVSPSALMSVLSIRLKPGLLKLAIVGKSNFMFFSFNTGFSFTNPLFLKKKFKKKKVMLKC